MREWYSFPQGLAEASRQDGLRPAHLVELVRRDEGDLLVFMDENQGVCQWAAQLTGTDDPPVVVTVEDGPWQPHARTFSDHIFCAVWDWRIEYRLGVGAQAQQLEPHDLVFLRHHFDELPSTLNWPGSANYRFRGPGVRLRLSDAPGQCDWYVFAEDPAAFNAVLGLLLPHANLATALYGYGPEAERLLRQILAGSA